MVFVLTGGTAALVNVISRIGLSQFLRFEIAVLAAYSIGMITAYALARRYVFPSSRQGIRRSFAAFALVNMVAVAQTMFVSIGIKNMLVPLIGAVALADLIAHVIGVSVPCLTSFIGHKYITFRDKSV